LAVGVTVGVLVVGVTVVVGDPAFVDGCCCTDDCTSDCSVKVIRLGLGYRVEGDGPTVRS